MAKKGDKPDASPKSKWWQWLVFVVLIIVILVLILIIVSNNNKNRELSPCELGNDTCCDILPRPKGLP
jgi:uncharacterized protein YpmS